MMQEWAYLIDAWVDGRRHIPTLLPPSTPHVVLESTL